MDGDPRDPEEIWRDHRIGGVEAKGSGMVEVAPFPDGIRLALSGPLGFSYMAYTDLDPAAARELAALLVKAADRVGS